MVQYLFQGLFQKLFLITFLYVYTDRILNKSSFKYKHKKCIITQKND